MEEDTLAQHRLHSRQGFIPKLEKATTRSWRGIAQFFLSSSFSSPGVHLKLKPLSRGHEKNKSARYLPHGCMAGMQEAEEPAVDLKSFFLHIISFLLPYVLLLLAICRPKNTQATLRRTMSSTSNFPFFLKKPSISVCLSPSPAPACASAQSRASWRGGPAPARGKTCRIWTG